MTCPSGLSTIRRMPRTPLEKSASDEGSGQSIETDASVPIIAEVPGSGTSAEVMSTDNRTPNFNAAQAVPYPIAAPRSSA